MSTPAAHVPLDAAHHAIPPRPDHPPFEGLPDLDALHELRQRPHWLAWDYVWNAAKGKWDKPPICARNGNSGSSTNVATWTSYDQAAAYAAREGLAGVGFALAGDGMHSGIDLDECRDPETGVFQHWAQAAIDLGETYAEISPSGRGLRFFIKGAVAGRKKDSAKVEIYTSGRYLTVTGRHVPGTPTEIREAPRLVAYLQERADQFRAAEQAASERAREHERKKAEKQAERQAQDPSRGLAPSVSERATASALERGPREGSDFWRSVNDRALANLGAWVTSVFPGARYQPGTGGYRVCQRDLGESYEEDLSLHPDGIRDFGIGDMGDPRDGARSPIDIVRDYLPAQDAPAAALWLCNRLGTRPEELGWRNGRSDGPASERTAGLPSEESSAAGEAKADALPSFKARPFVWMDPATIPRREWVLERHLIRKFISVTAAPGGVGKSSLVLADGLAMATGRNLIGHRPHGQYRVLIWNGEDPLEEMQRRIMAACLQYEISQVDIEGRLFVNSGRDDPIIIAEQKRDGVTIAVPVVEAIKATIRENKIDVVQIDPFVSCHAVNENDNGAIDRVAKLWGKIADETGCAIELVHHTRKTGGNETVMEDMRGAVALLSAARSGRVLNVMSGEEAERAGVDQRRLYFRIDNGKANLAPPPTDRSSWFKMTSVDLGNGPVLKTGGIDTGISLESDSVGVVTAWEWPDPLADVTTADLRAAQAEVRSGGPWRENIQATDWVGKPIARALKLDCTDKAHREKIKRLLKIWIENDMFVVVPGTNEKGRPTPFVEVGQSAAD